MGRELLVLLSLSEITRYYGAEIILNGVSLGLEEGEKAGLIGPNGSGKTTLLKIIAGELEADGGEVHLARGAKVGYLPQEPRRLEGGDLRSHLVHPLRHVYQMQEQIAALEKEIASGAGAPPGPGTVPGSLEGRVEVEGCVEDRLQKRLEEYAALTARFEAAGGYQVESRLSAVARGLGFGEADLGRDLSGFSGGEKTRARLAGLLLQELDLLLLDEPTNFLDLQALEWLEKYLRDHPAALLIVSHDRFFLDRLAGRIFALDNHRVRSYPGNYSAYRHRLEQEKLSVQREQKRLRLLREREERLVREAKGDERSKRQARSRQKRLDRLGRVEGPAREKRFRPGLDYSGRSGRKVITFEDVEKTFDTRMLFSGLDFEICWGDRVALVGPNGAGKSTLLRMISGDISPTAGRVSLGPAVRITYFSQEQEQLDPRHSLVEAITAVSELDVNGARAHLGGYLFSGEEAFKRVGDLSGGEKSRLALARLALSSGNCLLMDEPTSHLDLPALVELEKSLCAYPGTLVVVSHDRYFLQGLANRVFELEAGGLRIYDGSFREYLELKEEPRPEAEGAGLEKREEKRRRQEEHRLRRAGERELRRLRERQAALEAEIGAAEEKIATLEKTLSDPVLYGDHTRLAALGRELEGARSSLETLIENWASATEQLDHRQDENGDGSP